MVRLPRTVRHVLRRLSAAPLILQRGIRLASTAPALTIAERQHTEWVLGAGRVALCLAALLSLAADPTSASDSAQLATLLLGSYAAFGVFALLAAAPGGQSAFPAHMTHAVDFVAAAGLTITTSGPAPFYLFFVYILLGAAYRWGLRATLITALTAVLVLCAEQIFAGISTASGPFAIAQLDLHRLLTRSTYLIVAGALVGWLAESELQRRAEIAFVSDALTRLQSETSVHAAMRDIGHRMLALFGADRLMAAVHDPATGGLYLWTAARGESRTAVTVREVGVQQRGQYFFSAPGDAWEIHRAGRGRKRCASFGPDGQWLGERECSIPDAIWGDSTASTLAGVELNLAGQWSGRVFLLGPRPLHHTEVAFLQKLIDQVAPAVLSVYLVRRLRARVSAAERARVARELHDGIIQSLAGLRFDVAALRRHADRGLPIEAELARLEHVLADQTIAARELMHRVRPIDVTPHQLPEYLGALVERFTRETGIPAHYHTDLEQTDLPPRTCRELARTLQEALVNVRKHSAARHVVVRFAADPIHYRLTIDNDGRPFEFAGRLTLAELEAARRGPLVIKERVREMGGDLVIESSPDRGVRLDVLLRRTSRARSSKTA